MVRGHAARRGILPRTGVGGKEEVVHVLVQRRGVLGGLGATQRASSSQSEAACIGAGARLALKTPPGASWRDRLPHRRHGAPEQAAQQEAGGF